MGKTPKPLRILLTEPELVSHPVMQELASKGHSIEPLTQECDLVVGQKAWRLDLRLLAKAKDVVGLLQDAWGRVYPSKGYVEPELLLFALVALCFALAAGIVVAGLQ